MRVSGSKQNQFILKTYGAVLFFGLLTLFQFRATLPHLTQSIIGQNTDYVNLFWTIGWGMKHFIEGFSGYWSPPFYAPLPTTMGMGENTLGSSLVSLPFYLATSNPIFSFNMVLLISFALTGLFTTFLCFHLTKNFWASLLSGTLISYCAFRMGRVDHLHMLPFQYIPLFLLFGHLYVQSKKPIYLVPAYLAIILQTLTSLTLGLYSFYLSFLFWVYWIISDKSMRSKKNTLTVASFQIGLGIVFAWIAMPNLILKVQNGASMNWRWGDAVLHSATLGNFLTPSKFNFLFFEWMSPFLRGLDEFSLFPGLATLFLIGFAFHQWWKPGGDHSGSHRMKWMKIGVSFLFFVVSLMALLIFVKPDLFKSWDLSKYDKIYLSNWAILLGILRIVMDRKLRSSFSKTFLSIDPTPRFYVVLSVLGFLFTFPIFYKILWIGAPGFHGVRVAVRLALFFQLGLTVIAAYGFCLLIDKKNRFRIKKPLLVTFLLVFVGADVFSRKIPTQSVPSIPPVYGVLQKDPGLTGLIDLPFIKSVDDYVKQTEYVYFATDHWLPLVAGYSSHNPSYYYWLIEAVKHHPLPPADYMRVLNVNRVVLHWNKMTSGDKQRIKEKLKTDDFVFDFEEGFVSVYKVIDKPVASASPPPNALPEDVVIRTSVREKKKKYINDGKTNKKWSTGRGQQIGDWVEIHFTRPTALEGIRLELGRWFQDYPRGLKVEVEEKGHWREVFHQRNAYPQAQDFSTIVHSVTNPSVTVPWESVVVEKIRMTLTADHPDHHWAIAEMKIIPSL